MKKHVYKNIISALGIPPQTISGSTPIKGTGVDRTKYRSCKVVVGVGAATGSPDAVAHTFTLQDATADTDGLYGTPSIGAQTITASSKTALEYELDIDLSACKKWVRILATPAFTGGAGPTQPISCHIVFGDAIVEPVV